MRKTSISSGTRSARRFVERTEEMNEPARWLRDAVPSPDRASRIRRLAPSEARSLDGPGEQGVQTGSQGGLQGRARRGALPVLWRKRPRRGEILPRLFEERGGHRGREDEASR